MNYKVLDPNESYTFSRYGELPYAPEDILADLGYSLIRVQNLPLPYAQGELSCLEFLKGYINRNLIYVNPIAEIARREILIAPTIMEVCAETQSRLSIEYTLNVNPWLKGSLDYYSVADRSLLVIEAKREDLSKGFTQLATELIALDQWLDSEEPVLYGAVTTGEIWRFGVLHRASRQITENLTLYPLLDRMEDVLRILIGILRNPIEA